MKPMIQTWIFLTDVLPRAIKKYGGTDPEALRKAALDTDIPDGGTIQGYGVKFFPPGSEMAGQNERCLPVVTQFISGKTEVVAEHPVAKHAIPMSGLDPLPYAPMTTLSYPKFIVSCASNVSPPMSKVRRVTGCGLTASTIAR